VCEGETVVLLGTNGNGKNTLMKCLMGLVQVDAGEVFLETNGQRIDLRHKAPEAIVNLGMTLVPEGRRLFPSLSVEENLLMGAYAKRPGPWNLDAIYKLFPLLKDKRRNPGTALSGGQQQIVAMGRALMSNPKLLICDEISLGLAPIVVKEIYDALPNICAGGLTAIIVEQDVGVAQQVSSRLYCLQEGRVTLTGASNQLTCEQISQAYFGV
jgi:branched-chain amino acid transport system ATP-binding protein